MDETKRRVKRARYAIRLCKVREKALDDGDQRAEELIYLNSTERIEALRKKEREAELLRIESLRQWLSPRERVTLREREERDRELFAPSERRPRRRRRRPIN